LKRIAAALLMLLLAAAAGSAAAGAVDIAIPLQGSGHGDVAKAMRHALLRLDPDLQISIVTVDPSQPPLPNRGAKLLIAVGEQLLSWAAAADTYAATLCFYVGSADFDRIGNRNGRKLGALFRDQPLPRQLQLAQLLLPHLSRLAVIYRASETPPWLEQLQERKPVAVTAIDVAERGDWIKAVSDLMVDHDALLAIDDSHLYNRNTVRSILLTTYRHRRVLIGPSRPFVTAGSLASAYTTSDQYLAQLVQMVAVYLEQGQLPEPQYPAEFHVAINYQVAASLGLQLPDEQTVAHRLREVE
jgi:hypothetical protein